MVYDCFKNHRLKIIIIVLFFLAIKSFAQTYTLTVNADSASKSFLKKINYQNSFTSKPLREKALRKILSDFYANGYLTASIDSTFKDSLNMTAFIHAGYKIEFAIIKKGNANDLVLTETKIPGKHFFQQTHSYKEISELIERLLTYYENNGYPFAVITFDSIIEKGHVFEASLNIKKNNQIVIDSIINKGDARIATPFLFSYLGFKKGELYNESKIKKIDSKLKQLSFLNIKKPTQFLFSEDENKIILTADKRKTSQFDGIVGFMPNSQSTGKPLLTGEAHLMLLNSFARGELIDLSWRRLQALTQDIDIHLSYPYLFSSPFGIDYKFHLLKQDSSYITLHNNIGIQYFFNGDNYLKAFVDQNTSSLLKNQSLENITSLPPYADVATTLYGLELKYNHLDYIFNPRKGYRIKIISSAGNKNIKKNSQINQTLYDSLKLKTAEYHIEANLGIFIPVFKKSTIWINNQMAYINNSMLFENELFRIGGLNSLRGFDEESIHASFYNILLIEYRYLFEKNSFFNLFWNGCYYEKKTHQSYVSDTPYGFGAGISFETKAGIFSLNYALGKQFDNSINFKSGKIHFGIVSYF